MSTVLRHNRKAGDDEIVRLNACGFSLKTVGQILGLHPTTVTIRLQQLKVPPADTRRAFMEGVFAGLTIPQQEWLADQLNAGVSVKDYVTQLVRDEHARRQQQHPQAHAGVVQGSQADAEPQ
ncbi:hypothetical protein PP761_gp77 [Stenotrophomonas phage Paxi]|uniref:Uncharacterized protein n=1 Tax=Stenotrophomonas phage Paxi TaxID=2859653 RepID=A0AAE7WLS6_9CAUD|nr:hypothetical protein PP761_gp77 [Stenotrophomonas phage Paxi]QYW01818.1 hypothetical protein CPT_Paxi_052 [Stenotrophomonas phage Paxi]